ncbi:MAG: hypothetical protein M3040_09320, partial [Bacteroidota bacterium]|nr:hypothetical protein [Bacteroidota bacterium]
KNRIALTLSYRFGVDLRKPSNCSKAVNNSLADKPLVTSKKDLLRFVDSADVIVSIKTFIILLPLKP